MKKIINCARGGPIVIISNDDRMTIIEAFGCEIDNNDKHEIIMALIATMPDYMKRRYAPEPPRLGGW